MGCLSHFADLTLDPQYHSCRRPQAHLEGAQQIDEGAVDIMQQLSYTSAPVVIVGAAS